MLGAISGFFFGISLSLLLLTFGHVALGSIVLVLMPPIFLVIGIIWGLAAPLGRGPRTAFAPAPPPPAPAMAAPPSDPAPPSPSEVAPEASGEGADEGGGSGGAV